MPMYEYECADCSKTFDEKKSFEEHDRHKEIRCPHCGGTNVHQVVTPVGVQTGGATVKLGVSGQQLTITVTGIDALGISLPLPAVTVPVPVLVTAMPPSDCPAKSAMTTPEGVMSVARGDCDATKNVPSPLPRNTETELSF